MTQRDTETLVITPDARGDTAPVTTPRRTAIEHCRKLTAEHSSTFYLGSRFFTAEQRWAVWAVYAACRVGDDIADEREPATALAHLDAWHASVRDAIDGRPTTDPVAQALAWTAQRFPIRKAPFDELYLGLRMDLNGTDYDTLDQLLLYCRRVAGTVGWMIAPISGFDGGAHTLELALKLGMAMQLTNILRDVGEDLERGRVYLPAELMRRHGVTTDDLRANRVTTNYVNLMRDLERTARALYREGWRGIPRLHGPARLAVAVAAASYEGILGALERNGWDNFTRRAHVSNPGKLALIPGAWWTLRRLDTGTP